MKDFNEFYKNARKKDGLSGCCKICSNERTKAYKSAHPERVAAASAAYYVANREQVNATKLAYRNANKERIKKVRSAYYLANRDRIKKEKAVKRFWNLLILYYGTRNERKA